MKIQKLISGLCLLLFITNSIAQEQRKPWNFGLGINSVKYFTHQPSDWSLDYSAIRLSVGRNVWKNFSAEISYAMNEVQDFAGEEGLVFDHSALDVSALYNFGPHLYNGRKPIVDPYAGIGTGWSQLKTGNTSKASSITVNLISGVNIWAFPSLALSAQMSYKHSSDTFLDPYLEAVIGIRYRFSLKPNETCFP